MCVENVYFALNITIFVSLRKFTFKFIYLNSNFVSRIVYLFIIFIYRNLRRKLFYYPQDERNETERACIEKVKREKRDLWKNKNSPLIQFVHLYSLQDTTIEISQVEINGIKIVSCPRTIQNLGSCSNILIEVIGDESLIPRLVSCPCNVKQSPRWLHISLSSSVE